MTMEQENGASFEGSMLKLLRTLPKVLKYLPSDKAKDARSFMLSFQYWLGGSPENLESLLLMVANTYIYEDQKAVCDPALAHVKHCTIPHPALDISHCLTLHSTCAAAHAPPVLRLAVRCRAFSFCPRGGLHAPRDEKPHVGRL